MAEPRIQSPSDEAELNRISLIYAQACDKRDGDALGSIFVEDAKIEGPGFAMEGRANIAREIPKVLAQQFMKTRHYVHNTFFKIQGESATGETYCIAHHINEQPDGQWSDYVMVITYVDRYVKQAGRWFIKHRELQLDWTEAKTVHPPRPVA